MYFSVENIQQIVLYECLQVEFIEATPALTDGSCKSNLKKGI